MTSVEDIRGNEPNRNFSNADITWEIESFPLIIYTENVICCPPITLLGPFETLWKIYLHRPENKNRLLLKVEMLPNKSPINKVNLHWAFCLLDETENVSFSSERTYSYEPKTILTLEYLSLKRMLEIASMNKYYNLILKCHMLVDFGLKVVFPKVKVPEVEHLSNDLCNLPTSFLYHDTAILVNDVEFSLHEAVLFFNGRKLVSFMKQSTSNERDNFSLSKTKAATAVLNYLYTGNLKLILEDPCLTISDYMENLKISELENVYSPQRITVTSKIEVKEHPVIWEVFDFKNITGTVSGTEFKISADSRFQLGLNVEESDDDPPKKSLSVEVTLIESKMLSLLCLEFLFGKDENQILCTRRTHRVVRAKDRLGVTLQENDCPEIFQNEKLLIKVLVYTSVGKVFTYSIENENISTKISNEKSLMCLSRTMEVMNKTAVHSDFHFEVDNQEIKAHKFLVAARSSAMKELFRRNEGLVSVQVHSCTKEVFEKFLHYMYIGILTENDGDKLTELYNLGKQYNVDGLLKVVPQVLTKFINEANMLRIMIFADDIEDDGLKKGAFSYVIWKRNILLSHEDHDMFKSKKPQIYRQILNIASMD